MEKGKQEIEISRMESQQKRKAHVLYDIINNGTHWLTSQYLNICKAQKHMHNRIDNPYVKAVFVTH